MEKVETGKQKRRRIQRKGEKIGILFTNPNIKERGKDLEMLCGRIIRNWEYLRLQREWLQCMKNGNGVIKHLRSFWTQSLHGIGIVWLRQRYIELCCLINKVMVRDSVFELKNGKAEQPLSTRNVKSNRRSRSWHGHKLSKLYYSSWSKQQNVSYYKKLWRKGRWFAKRKLLGAEINRLSSENCWESYWEVDMTTDWYKWHTVWFYATEWNLRCHSILR